MEKVYLTAREALRALADGAVLENADGCEIRLASDGKIVMQYAMGKHNTLVTADYADSLAGLFTATPPEQGEPDGP
jgi:hypothetical protein